MRRQFLINASLLVLALLLVGLVGITRQQQDGDESVNLTPLSPDQISLIVIESGARPAIRLELGSGGWMMTQPSTAKANESMVKDLLEITQAKSIRRFQSPEDVAEFGLAPPQAVIILNQTRIEMGDIHPITQRRYMRVGDTIHLINDRFPHLLQAAPESYIERKKP